MAPHRHDRGQALPLLLVVLAAATAAAVLVAELGLAAVERARARTAADAAALAGAAEGEAMAASVAADNGAELIAFTHDGQVVTVEVRHRRATATATAEAPPPVAGGMAPALAAAVDRAGQLLGRPVPVVAVTADGAAVEVDAADAAALDAVAVDSGLCRQSGGMRLVHFGPCPLPNAPG